MNYELAKKLKDEGFPQNFPHELFCLDCKKPREIKCLDEGHKKEGLTWPGLSELIEACGDEFQGLVKNENGWRAWSNRETGRGVPTLFTEEGKTLAYSKEILAVNGYLTPEEAAANLWIKTKSVALTLAKNP